MSQIPSLIAKYFVITFLLLFHFSFGIYAQVVIPLNQLNRDLDLENNQQYQLFKVNENLFVSTNNGVWVLEKDGIKLTKISGLNTKANAIETANNMIYVLASGKIWVLSEDYKSASKVNGIDVTVSGLTGTGNFLHIGSQNQLLIIKNGNQINYLPKFNNNLGYYEAFDNKLYVIKKSDSTLWVIDSNSLDVKQIEGIIGQVVYFEPIGENLMIFTKDNSMYILEKNNERVYKVNGYTGGFFSAQLIIGNYAYLIGRQGLWLMKKDSNEIARVTKFDGDIFFIKPYGEQLLVGSEDGLWQMSLNGDSVTKFEDIEGRVNFLEDLENKMILSRSIPYYLNLNNGKLNEINGIWIFNKDGKELKKVQGLKDIDGVPEKFGKTLYLRTKDDIYQIRPNLIIKTNLISTSWWDKLLRFFSFSNYLPTDQAEAEAYYSDGSDKIPFDEVLTNEFRFAKAEGDKMPADDRFSIKEQFRYEVEWYSNNVHYWVKDKWGNTFEHKVMYYGVPIQNITITIALTPILFVFICFIFAPKINFCHSAIMNPFLRNYFSLGIIPVLISVFPSVRRYILRRYSSAIAKDKDITEWQTRFVPPTEEFLPETFGEKIYNERKLLLLGRSGIGKTSFLKYLMAYYVSKNKFQLPTQVFPVYISLTNLGNLSIEELIYNQLFSYGNITDKELAPIFWEYGGWIILLDGVNEVQNIADRQKLSEFIEKYWMSNYICISSQQSYPEIENIPIKELQAFSPEKVNKFILSRVKDKNLAEKVIEKLTKNDYELYSVPRDLEFAVTILNDNKDFLPKSRTELYVNVFSSIFAKWKGNDNLDAENMLCERAYLMIVERALIFDSVSNPKFSEITNDLFDRKFLVKREQNYLFRHDLIRSYLASEYFSLRWRGLFAALGDKKIDSNWLEMLKFTCDRVDNSLEIKSLVYEVMNKSIRKDLVKDLVIWLKVNHSKKCKSWEEDFYSEYGKLDFN